MTGSPKQRWEDNVNINLKEMDGGLGSLQARHHAHVRMRVCARAHKRMHTYTHMHQVCHKDSNMSSKSQSSLHQTNIFHTKMKQFKFLKSEVRNEVRCGIFISPLITTIYDKKSSKQSKITSA
jgi:hypothetical protein